MSGWSGVPLDLIVLGCPVLTSYPLERAMAVLVYLGHGVVDAVIGLAFLAYGMLARDRRMRQAGVAALLAVVLAGLAANLFKLAFRLPRPVAGWGYGFPSGHTSTAFALAGTLGQVFPAAAPFLYLLALAAGVARLYERSHFVLDVLGGALLGVATAILIGRRVLSPTHEARRTAAQRWQWVLPVAVGALALGFFSVYERALAAHRPSPAEPPERSVRFVAIKFGTPEARPYLLEGWVEPPYRVETFPSIWVEGEESALSLPPLPPAAGYRIRILVRPYVRRGGRALCQVVEVALNGVPVGRLLLERDWNEYELKVVQSLVGTGAAEMRFRFASVHGSDERAPRVAFASLEVFADQK